MSGLDDPELPNNLVATGALYMLLRAAYDTQSALTGVRLPETGPGNQIDVTLSFMDSPYRLTVNRVPDDE